MMKELTTWKLELTAFSGASSSKPDGELPRKLLPMQLESTEAVGGVLLVKVNFFECGDMAIGMSISHKIADLSTLSKFRKSWAAMAQRPGLQRGGFRIWNCTFHLVPTYGFTVYSVRNEIQGTKVCFEEVCT